MRLGVRARTYPVTRCVTRRVRQRNLPILIGQVTMHPTWCATRPLPVPFTKPSSIPEVLGAVEMDTQILHVSAAVRLVSATSPQQLCVRCIRECNVTGVAEDGRLIEVTRHGGGAGHVLNPMDGSRILREPVSSATCQNATASAATEPSVSSGATISGDESQSIALAAAGLAWRVSAQQDAASSRSPVPVDACVRPTLASVHDLPLGDLLRSALAATTQYSSMSAPEARVPLAASQPPAADRGSRQDFPSERWRVGVTSKSCARTPGSTWPVGTGAAGFREDARDNAADTRLQRVHGGLLQRHRVTHARADLGSPEAEARALASVVSPGDALESAPNTSPLRHFSLRGHAQTDRPIQSSPAKHCPAPASPRPANRALQESIAAAEIAVAALAALARHRMRSPSHSAELSSVGCPPQRSPLPSPDATSHRDRSFLSMETTASDSSCGFSATCLPATPLAPAPSARGFDAYSGAVSLAGLRLESPHSDSPNEPRPSPRPYIAVPAVDGLSASPTLRELRAAHGAVGLAMSQLNRHLRLNFGKP